MQEKPGLVGQLATTLIQTLLCIFDTSPSRILYIAPSHISKQF